MDLVGGWEEEEEEEEEEEGASGVLRMGLASAPLSVKSCGVGGWVGGWVDWVEEGGWVG